MHRHRITWCIATALIGGLLLVHYTLTALAIAAVGFLFYLDKSASYTSYVRYKRPKPKPMPKSKPKPAPTPTPAPTPMPALTPTPVPLNGGPDLTRLQMRAYEDLQSRNQASRNA